MNEVHIKIDSDDMPPNEGKGATQLQGKREDNMMRVIVCDDDLHELQTIGRYCRSIRHIGHECYLYNSAKEMLSRIEELAPIDVVVLDIEMPEINGIMVKEQLQSRCPTTWIIFLTSHTEMMQEAFGRNVTAFIQKTDWREQLGRELEKIYSERGELVTVSIGGEQRDIRMKDIVSIVADNYYSRIIFNNGQSEIGYIKQSLNKWEQNLQQTSMYRISRNAIVNMENIEIYQGDTITMSNGAEYKLPKGTVKKFKKAYFEYMRRTKRVI